MVILILKPPDDMAKNSHLKHLQALGELEVLRADLDEEGSFDEAVAGCDYAFLVAAPVNIKTENPEVYTILLYISLPFFSPPVVCCRATGNGLTLVK